MAIDDPTVPNVITQRDVDRIKELESNLKNAAVEQQRFNAVMSEFNDTITEQRAALESARVQHQAGIITLNELKAKEQEVADTVELTIAIRNEARAVEERHREEQRRDTEALEEANKVLAAKKGLISDVADVMRTALGPELSKVTLGTKDLAKEFMGMSYNLDAMRVNLAQATGMGSQFNQVAVRMASQNNGLNISLKSGHEILGELSTGYQDFNALSGDNQTHIGELVGYYKHLGVAVADSAQAIDLLDNSLGMSREGAISSFNDFESLADQVGMSYSAVVKGFNESAKALSRFGPKGKEVFSDLQKQARSLGLSVKQVFDVSELFDTFESGADIAGKLNAQLGMQLNSVALLSTENSADRIKMLKAEFDMQGTNFKDMHRRQKQMVAEILKVDVGTAQRLLGDPMELRAYQREEEKRQDRLDKYTEASTQLAEIWEEMFITIEPMATAFLGIMKTFAQALGKIVNTSTVIIGIGSKIALSMVTAGKALGTVTSGAAALAKALKGVAIVGGIVTGIIEYMKTGNIGDAFAVGTGSMIGASLGLAMGATLGPVGAIAGALLGGMLGEGAARMLMSATSPQKGKTSPTSQPMINDYAVIGNKMHTFNKDDLHIQKNGQLVGGGTRLGGGGSKAANQDNRPLVVNLVLDNQIIDTQVIKGVQRVLGFGTEAITPSLSALV